MSTIPPTRRVGTDRSFHDALPARSGPPARWESPGEAGQYDEAPAKAL
ncbi:hypothetical protein [Streptacidiphilus jiangxiensis]|uniref:Uncharacterized protein n=1 Tax=Streptacidiphilus jiangxiensis TaxID=235985 RepID=A0A1H7PL95_STRJI|nr:hypothetical protein [Streptacidiphilus jiangxiensis]SEL36570.1 hypothetical protein SAMN05414137_10815 [Streptacidiphilus jiangxiensis]